MDASGNIYVADSGNNAIRKMTPAAVVSTFAGTGVQGSTNNAVSTSATFGTPRGIAFDLNGNLIVADSHNTLGHTIRMIAPGTTVGGAVTTIAGLAGTQATTDGDGTVARFNMPYALASDPFGSIYVADSFNATLRRMIFTGTSWTVSSPSTPALYQIRGLATDAQGNLYLGDSGNNLVRRGVPYFISTGTYGTKTTSSSLGAPVNVANATIDLGTLTSTGVLLAIGTSEVTNRPINLAGTTGGGVLDFSGTGALVFTGSVTSTGAGSKTLTLRGSSSGTGALYGTIFDNSPSNTTSLLKQGTGKWTVGGVNAYSGGTTIAQGTLVIGGLNALGTGSLTINDGAALDAVFPLTMPAFGQTWNGSFTFLGNNSLDVSAGSVSLAANSTVTVAAGTLTVANLSGDYALSKGGIGTLVLSGTNNFSGTVNVTAGTLVINGPSALPATVSINASTGTTVLMKNGAPIPIMVGATTLAYDAGTTVIYGALDASGNVGITLSGTSTLTKVGAGSITLTSSGSFTGKTWVQQGTLNVSSVGVIDAGSYSWSTLASSVSTTLIYGGVVD
jgi:autotransporter-associated beta strand protein